MGRQDARKPVPGPREHRNEPSGSVSGCQDLVHIASNVRLCEEAVLPFARREGKAAKILNEDSMCLGLDSNRSPPSTLLDSAPWTEFIHPLRRAVRHYVTCMSDCRWGLD